MSAVTSCRRIIQETGENTPLAKVVEDIGKPYQAKSHYYSGKVRKQPI
jgi:hypothetical protein